MLRNIRWPALALVLASAALIYVAGCNAPSNAPSAPPAEPKQEAKAPDAKKDGDHGHKPGAHGGIMVEIGRDNYHAEAIFEKGGTVRLYTLGKDETKVQEVEAQELTAYAKADGGTESVTFVLAAQPQPGDAAGKASLFVGQLPTDLHGKRVEVTIPSFRINGERFRVAFKSFTEAAHDGAMPTAIGGDEARQLYLVPGGIYTAADVKANGTTTAPQKYAGKMAKHDMRPKAGDKICPVTFTKANPEFTWVVAGKTYEFCCTPCIDEFVTWAKEQPDQVKEPHEYVKKK